MTRSAVVAVTGELDIATAPALRERLAVLVDDGHTHLILDFADVPFIDSSAIGTLLSLRASDGAGPWIAIARAQERVRRVFALTGIDGLLALYDTVEEASAAAGS